MSSTQDLPKTHLDTWLDNRPLPSYDVALYRWEDTPAAINEIKQPNITQAIRAGTLRLVDELKVSY